MRILALKPGHDGHITSVNDGVLDFSLEAEKDSGHRYAEVDGINFATALSRLEQTPDVYALSGWASGDRPAGRHIGAGYFGVDRTEMGGVRMCGENLHYFSSTHERSHLMCSYALSPFPQGTKCFALIWEGYIGAFYEIDEQVNINCRSRIMAGPGIRYAFAYALCDPTFDLAEGHVRLSDAGKLMALAAYEPKVNATLEEEMLLARLMSEPQQVPVSKKDSFSSFSAFNCGVESVTGKRLARLISDALLGFFKSKIADLVTEKRPLLIGGGCGLNCDWNRSFLDCGLFTDVFVPPCTNDSGSAIGTAADAQLALTGDGKIKWSVYCGDPFLDDLDAKNTKKLGEFLHVSSRPEVAARLLYAGAVLAWISGRSEMGPRALGNRSLLAEPFNSATSCRLNRIKNRESFRPIAPICLEEDVAVHFDLDRPSPHMLYFSRVRNDTLYAVTHVDGSSRVQTVNHEENPRLHGLLNAFKRESGSGVLCNTSLNFNGKGFINRTADLLRYANLVGLDGFAIEGAIFIRDPHRFKHCL